MMKIKNPEKYSPLTMYIAYEYLPLDQQANILKAIDGIYKAILNDQINHHNLSPFQYLKHTPLSSDLIEPRLCIVQAQTGNSINFKFDHNVHILPRVSTSEDDIDIYIPPWTVAVILTGAILNGGVDSYNKYLDITKKRIDIEKSQIELHKLRDTSTPEHHNIQIYINQFKYEINQENIIEVKINNSTLKSNVNKKTSR